MHFQLKNTFVKTLCITLQNTHSCSLHYFLGIKVKHAFIGLMPTQQKYYLNILHITKMSFYKPIDSFALLQFPKSIGSKELLLIPLQELNIRL